MTISQLQQDFKQAIDSEEVENIEKVLLNFDAFCREKVEAESDLAQKKQLIEDLLQVEKQWQQEILQLKAKVREKIADIKSNGKKISKYLTSY